MANITEIVKELQQERDRLDRGIGALERLAGVSRTSSVRGGAGGPRRTLSAAARRKVSLAQKARWARLRAENSAKGQPSTVNPGKRTMSAAARRKIAATQRARKAEGTAEEGRVVSQSQKEESRSTSCSAFLI